MVRTWRGKKDGFQGIPILKGQREVEEPRRIRKQSYVHSLYFFSHDTVGWYNVSQAYPLHAAVGENKTEEGWMPTQARL